MNTQYASSENYISTSFCACVYTCASGLVVCMLYSFSFGRTVHFLHVCFSTPDCLNFYTVDKLNHFLHTNIGWGFYFHFESFFTCYAWYMIIPHALIGGGGGGVAVCISVVFYFVTPSRHHHQFIIPN